MWCDGVRSTIEEALDRGAFRKSPSPEIDLLKCGKDIDLLKCGKKKRDRSMGHDVFETYTEKMKEYDRADAEKERMKHGV